MSRRLDLRGLKFIKLLVLDIAYTKGKHIYWTCKCDCGKETVQCTTNLQQGKVYSCGCERTRLSIERLAHLPKVKFETGIASFNVLFYQYKFAAKRRHLSFNLSKEEFKNLTQQDCHYCGELPKNRISRSRVNGEFVYNGIDRKDSTKGYILSNCVTSCAVCNLMKMALGYDEFLNQVNRISKHFYG